MGNNNNKEKKIFFVTGLWGAGKSSLVESFKDFPHQPFQLIDFDFGGGITPPKDRTLHMDWRFKQTDYWLRFAQELVQNDKNIVPVICGVSLFPSQLFELESVKFWSKSEIGFAHLIVDDEERKRRLIERGDGEIFTPYKRWYPDFYSELEKVNSFEIDTTLLSKSEVAQKIYTWLKLTAYSRYK